MKCAKIVIHIGVMWFTFSGSFLKSSPLYIYVYIFTVKLRMTIFHSESLRRVVKGHFDEENTLLHSRWTFSGWSSTSLIASYTDAIKSLENYSLHFMIHFQLNEIIWEVDGYINQKWEVPSTLICFRDVLNLPINPPL